MLRQKTSQFVDVDALWRDATEFFDDINHIDALIGNERANEHVEFVGSWQECEHDKDHHEVKNDDFERWRRATEHSSEDDVKNYNINYRRRSYDDDVGKDFEPTGGEVKRAVAQNRIVESQDSGRNSQRAEPNVIPSPEW